MIYENNQHLKDQKCTTRDAAKMLQVSVGTVQKLVDTGRLLAWRTAGGHRRIPVNSINKYVRENNLTNTRSVIGPNIVLLFGLDEHHTAELISAALRFNVNLIVFHTAAQMQLELLHIRPSLVLIEDKIFVAQGGESWIEALKTHHILRSTRFMELSEINIKESERIITSDWLSGFASGWHSSLS